MKLPITLGETSIEDTEFYDADGKLIPLQEIIARINSTPSPEVAPIIQRYTLEHFQAFGETAVQMTTTTDGEWVKWEDIASPGRQVALTPCPEEKEWENCVRCGAAILSVHPESK